MVRVFSISPERRKHAAITSADSCSETETIANRDEITKRRELISAGNSSVVRSLIPAGTGWYQTHGVVRRVGGATGRVREQGWSREHTGIVGGAEG